VTTIVLLVMVVGLLGTVLPVLPGPILIFGAALLYAVLDGFHTVGWPSLVVLGLLTLAATGVDLLTSSIGARVGGASGWSIAAGMVGGLLGLIFLSLPGAILGALVCVLLVEIVRLKDWRHAAKSGVGWLVGWLLSSVVRLGIALTMIAIFVWQLL
jgi:uncharacterized protein YqgC (DUF456 family)